MIDYEPQVALHESLKCKVWKSPQVRLGMGWLYLEIL